MNIGGVLSSILNLVLTKWLLDATNFLTLYLAGAAVTCFAIAILCFHKEELDLENLRRRDVLLLRTYSVEK